MAHFVIGASGSGKTACLPALKKLLLDYEVCDFDDIGVPEGADKKWRQESTEKWIQKIVNSGCQERYCLLGQMVPGEILACPSAPKLTDINIYLLDCDDFTRIRRLKNRGTYGINQDTLNWAAWLRMHCRDPKWEQRVIKDDCWSGCQFARWDYLDCWDMLAKMKKVDTSLLSISQVSQCIADDILR